MILVVASEQKGHLSKATYELVTAARQLGDEDDVAILIMGSGVDALATEAAHIADQVLVADYASLAKFSPDTWSAAVATIAMEGEASLVLVPGNRCGRSYSPRVAVKLNAPLLEDVISLKRNGTTVTAERYSFLARATESLMAEAPVMVATIKSGIFPPAIARDAEAEQFEVELNIVPGRVKSHNERVDVASGASLSEAKIVVSGGRGVGSADGFEKIVVPLASALDAAIGATRAVVDAGWRPYTEQVGQTGKTVQPSIYIAIGISGATQHLSGMNKSKTIIAINKDRDAPIFKIADYGIVGDAASIIPALIERLHM